MTIHNPSEIGWVLSEYLENAPKIKTGKKISYYNVPCAFDIETTSFYTTDGNKSAIMYEWTLGLNGAVIVGRTWDEFLTVYNTIVETLKTCLDNRIVIYVHNLGFEFQFMRKRLKWSNVFSIDERKPIYATTIDGIEFRCSYLLSGYSLSSLGDQLRKYPIKKMVGDLDYKLIRHSRTPLTDREIGYCVNDVRVVMNYILERIESDGDISRIPYTKTGYVRTYCRNACMYDGNHKKNGWKFIDYHRLMLGLRLDPEEYEQLKRAFQGGYTHANAFYSGQTLENVASFDFTSSYPAVMCSEMFPMSSAQRITITSEQQFRKNLNCYCCLFDVEIHGLESIRLFEHPLSASRCRNVKGAQEDNGRIVQADSLTTTLTEQDFFILEQFYKWKSISVGNFKRYVRGYLPREFVRAILKLYADKTTLKGVKGREEDYLRSKEMINSAYGMTVTDICRDEIIYSNVSGWDTDDANTDIAISKYNNSKKRFLFYPWGVWVTAYARKNLFTGIFEFGDDYIYSDTDSVKVLNAEKHQRYIDAYNQMITEKLRRAMEYQGLPFELTRPKTIEGKEKPLGVWDYEGTYTRFKTLGAKRYMTEKVSRDGETEVSITVSGVNKHSAVPYLLKKSRKCGIDVFDLFCEGLHIPERNDLGEDIYTAEGIKIDNPCGKNTHTYIDDVQTGTITDYFGIPCDYEELSSTHLEPTDYTLSLSRLYAEYLMGIREYNK